MKRLFILAGILFGISAFFYFKPHDPDVPADFSSSLPGRDEICVSKSIHLSMNSFESLRSHFSSVSPIHLVLIGLSSQWLYSSYARDGASLKDAARCVRALLPPLVDATELLAVNKLLNEKFGIPSGDILKTKLRDAWRGSSVEWNLSLLKEYGIEPVQSLWDKE
jgi:hypothetical protein